MAGAEGVEAVIEVLKLRGAGGIGPIDLVEETGEGKGRVIPPRARTRGGSVR